MSKTKIILTITVLAAILLAALYLRYGGVTHERIVEVVEDRSDEIKAHVDVRSDVLERKLDRIEQKLDRLLSIAERPLPDGLEPVR